MRLKHSSVGRAAEDGNSDRAFLERLRCVGAFHLDDIFEELSASRTAFKKRTGQDSIEFRLDVLVIDYRRHGFTRLPFTCL